MQRLYGCQPRAMGASGDHWFVPCGWYSSSNSRVSGVPSAPTCCRCEVLSAPDNDSQPGLHSTAQSVHRCCSAAAAAKALNSGSGRGIEVVMERCLGFHGLSGRFGGGLPVENILLFHEPGNATVLFTIDWTLRSAMVFPRLVVWHARVNPAARGSQRRCSPPDNRTPFRHRPPPSSIRQLACRSCSACPCRTPQRRH